MPCRKDGTPTPLSRVPGRGAYLLFGEPCDRSNLTVVDLPAIGKVRVHRRVAPVFSRVFTAISATGLAHLIDTKDYGGTYACREVRGGTLKSPHAWGIAVDLNVHHLFVGGKEIVASCTNWRCRRDQIPPSLERLAPFFEYWGFAWGGRWTDKHLDPMHYEATDLTLALLEAKTVPAAFQQYRESLKRLMLGEVRKLVGLQPPLLGVVSERVVVRHDRAYVPAADLRRFGLPDLPDGDVEVPVRAYFEGLRWRVVDHPEQGKIYVTR